MSHHPDIPKHGFVSPHWVKKRYSISNSTMYAWIASNHLPAPVKIGPRAVRFRVEDLFVFEGKMGSRSTNAGSDK